MKKTEQSSSRKKILIVDDNEGILDAITLILEDEGYIVQTISDGKKVLDRTKQFQPHLIILDVLLSGSDGRLICRSLKDNPFTQTIPVIMISAHPNIEASATESGANYFLAKPFSSTQLLTILTKHIEKHSD